MKAALAGAAFALLIASPLFAQSENARISRPILSQEQKYQLRAGNLDLDRQTRKTSQSTANPETAKQSLCSTAPGFCPDYHGSNGS
jgi:hypothetical protein